MILWWFDVNHVRSWKLSFKQLPTSELHKIHFDESKKHMFSCKFGTYLTILNSRDVQLPAFKANITALCQAWGAKSREPIVTNATWQMVWSANGRWSGQIIIFHQPRFPWNKGISLTKPPLKWKMLLLKPRDVRLLLKISVISYKYINGPRRNKNT